MVDVEREEKDENIRCSPYRDDDVYNEEPKSDEVETVINKEPQMLESLNDKEVVQIH